MRKILVAAVLIVLGAAGLFNGTALVSDPTGRTLGLRVDMLPAWHTWDYRISGLFVLLALGVAPLVCCAAVLVDASGTTPAVALIGAVTLAWVFWQIVVLDVAAPIPQIALALAGGVLLSEALRWSTVRRAFHLRAHFGTKVTVQEDDQS